jgi:hypothetical protein
MEKNYLKCLFRGLTKYIPGSSISKIVVEAISLDDKSYYLLEE